MVQVEDKVAIVPKLKKQILSDIGFKPTPAQQPIFDAFLDPTRFLLITGGWRAGKSETSAVLTVLGYYLDLEPVIMPKLYWIIGKDYETCRPEFYKALAYFKKLDLIVKVRDREEGQVSARLVGKVNIETRSVDDEWKIAEAAPDGILVVEAGRLSESAWHRIRGRAIEKRAWVALSGTLESSDPRAESWYPELFTEWQGVNEDKGKSFAMPSWSNLVIFPLGRNDPVILREERALPPDLFQEKYAALPVKPSGLICKEFSNEIHVGDYPYDPEIPVEIAVDPGYGGAYAVEAIQIKESIPYLVDEVYYQGYVTDDIITICKKRPWGVKFTTGAIDIAGKQHQAMPAPVEVWLEKTGVRLQSRKIDKKQGIDLLRTFLKVDPITHRPGLYVNYSVKGFISECGGCKSPVHGGGPWLWDPNTGQEIDRNNHASKALYYWLVNRFGYVTRERKTGIPVARFY